MGFTDEEMDALLGLKREIKRLRRILKIKPTVDEVREQTRRRTRYWRAARSSRSEFQTS